MTDRAEFREEKKLKLDYWKTVISLGSVVAIGLAVYQWHNSNRMYKNDLDSKMTALWREHNKALFDKPLVGQYLIRNGEIPDSATEAAVLTAADLRLEIIDEILNNSDEWPKDVLTWKSTFMRAFKNSKLLCKRYLETKSNFDNIEDDLSTEQLCKDLAPSAKAARRDSEVALSRFLKKWEILSAGVDKTCKEAVEEIGRVDNNCKFIKNCEQRCE